MKDVQAFTRARQCTTTPPVAFSSQGILDGRLARFVQPKSSAGGRAESIKLSAEELVTRPLCLRIEAECTGEEDRCSHLP